MTPNSLVEFRRSVGPLPKPTDTWRLCRPPVAGEVNGLGRTFRGLAIATNGIIVAIKQSSGNVVFGHLEWFVKDLNEPSSPDLDSAKARVTPRSSRPAKLVDTLLEGLTL